MFQIDRLKQIRKIVYYQRSVDVNELSSKLNVSEVTIRRDLEKLEQEGYLTRVHGGATICEGQSQMPEQIDPETNANFYIDHIPENSQIVGETAADIVDEYEVVFIGASSSGLALARELKNKNGISIVTNYLPICLELMRSSIRVIMTGGELDQKDVTLKSSHINYEPFILPVQKAFIPFHGFDMERGYVLKDREELQIYQMMKANAKYTIGMIEGQLFDKRGFITISAAEMDQVDAIVTDKSIPDRYRSFYYQNDIVLYEGFRLDEKGGSR